MVIWVVAIALLWVAAVVPYGPWIALGLLAGGYYLSIRLHPYAHCEACQGRGREYGSVFTYSLRRCHKCSNTGRKQRLGARWLGHGQARQGMTRWQ